MVPHRARHPLTALAFLVALGGCIEFSETPTPGSSADSTQVVGAPAGADKTAPAAAPAKDAAAKPADLLYRHGVEVTVRGNYLDMVDYMSALEAMPTRLFWGRAQLDVEEYPASRLTLTLHTLSLDRKWMKL